MIFNRHVLYAGQGRCPRSFAGTCAGQRTRSLVGSSQEAGNQFSECVVTVAFGSGDRSYAGSLLERRLSVSFTSPANTDLMTNESFVSVEPRSER